MIDRDGTVRLEWSIDAITVGRRHRNDLGDLDALAASIESEGLLQPPTITPDGVLICGARRLAAMRQLGYRTVSVWVRAGISDRLRQLMAEQADNAQHKPLTQTEAASLYRELKSLMADDASRRQETSRFHPREPAKQVGAEAASDGGAAAAPPLGPPGKSRAQASQMVTGRNSYTSLEQINDLQDIAADQCRPAVVREYARTELEGIDAGRSIRGAHARATVALSDPADRPSHEELQALADMALAQARAAKKGKRRPARRLVDGEPVRLPVRAFVHIWDDLDGWWTRFDAAEVARVLTPEQWRRFEVTVAGTNRFLSTARTVRVTAPGKSA
jgi:ParB family transcriptional regulator, chromosome partitioning protein